MKLTKLLSSMLLLFLINSCDSEVENKAEKVGEKIDEATEEVSDGVENFNDRARDYLKSDKEEK